jgi:hypothetical protein
MVKEGLATHVSDIPVGLRNSIGAGIGLVTAATVFARIHRFGADDLRHWQPWLEGVLTGAVVGAFCWILWRPRARLTRGMLVAVAINWAAWAAFIGFAPPLAEAEFHAVTEQRATRDSGGGLDFTTDRPTILAARRFGGFRVKPVPERVLVLMAGVPVLIAEQYVVPAHYVGSPPTRDESQVIAIIGFVVSTAFWTSVSGAMGWLRRRRSVDAGQVH